MSEWKEIISKYTDSAGVVLPGENVPGDPFWALMEIREGLNTGNYHSIGKKDNRSLIMLFPQREMADWAAERLREHAGEFEVRGLSAQHLEVLLRLCEDGYPIELVVSASGLDQKGDLCGAVMSPFQIRKALSFESN
ncbi:MAG: hypothetical protein M1130_01430 [Actinobacteria bacterium]|nr:hypothetical protein [Actinomycetota bacterium]